MNTITVNASNLNLATTLAASVPGREEPPVPPPSDQVDFSVIDTPSKAAAVPALDPAVQLGLAAGAAAVILGGMGRVQTATLDIAIKTAGVEGNLRYQADLKDMRPLPVVASGDFAGQNVSGDMVTDQATGMFGWEGKIGTNTDSVRITNIDKEAGRSKVHVQFGEVSGDLALGILLDENHDAEGFRISGQLGGLPYNVETYVREDLNGREAIKFDISSHGNLGDQAIHREYTAELNMVDPGLTLTIDGGGSVAGISQEVHGNLTITR